MRSLWARMWQKSSVADEAQRAPSGRYAEQIQKGFWTLHFLPDLERDYQRSFLSLNANSIRAAQVLGVLGTLAFLLIDHFTLRLSPPMVVYILCLVSIPSLLVPLSATYQKRGSISLQRISFAFTLLFGQSIAWVVWHGQQATPDFPTASVLVVTMYLYFLAGLLWVQTVLCGMLTWAAFLLPILLKGAPYPPQLAYDCLYLALANGIGMIGRYFQEYQDRRQFLMRLELHHLADYDGLTGLLNRRAFAHHAQVAWSLAIREHKSVSLLILDLDFLKRINDRHGHLTGDDCLREVAEALRHLTRRPLDAASRFGGDEFVALWYDAGPDWVEQLESHIHRQLEKRTGLSSRVQPLGVTGGGLRCWPTAQLSYNDALAMADEQLYGGKERGRGVVLWRLLSPVAADPNPATGAAATAARVPA